MRQCSPRSFSFQIFPGHCSKALGHPPSSAPTARAHVPTCHARRLIASFSRSRTAFFSPALSVTRPLRQLNPRNRAAHGRQGRVGARSLLAVGLLLHFQTKFEIELDWSALGSRLGQESSGEGRCRRPKTNHARKSH